MNHSSKSFLRLFILLAIFLCKDVKAQLSAADSVFFNTHFTEPLYVDPSIYPGDWYVQQPVISMSDLYLKLDTIFKYKSNDFNNSYNNLIVAPSFKYDTFINTTNNFYYNTFGNAFEQMDPLIKLDFSLKGISSTSYSTYTPSTTATDNEIGFFIIPGSNPNQTSDIMLNYGYHNYNCYVRDNLLNYGDVYVYCKPLEDYRALTWNGFKFNSSDYNTPGYRYIYDYLDSLHKAYGTNYLIECMAILKYMNERYKKVVVLGCSLGGFSALMTALNAPVDGAVVSSGYTKNIEYDPAFVFELSQNFDSLIYQYPNTVVKSKLIHSTTEFFFTWPNYDSYWYQLEHDSAYTEAFLNGVSNCSYYYDYEYHAFPQCYPIDTFLIKVINKPKVFFTTPDSLNSDTLHTTIDFAGQGPFSFDLYRNDNLFKQYNSVSSAMHDTLTQVGMYTIQNIINLNGVKGTCQDSILHSSRFPESIYSSIEENSILITPNPFNNYLEIRGSKSQTSIQIMNIFGELVYQSNLLSESQIIETSKWPSGIYLIQLNSKSNHKLLKYCKP